MAHASGPHRQANVTVLSGDMISLSVPERSSGKVVAVQFVCRLLAHPCAQVYKFVFISSPK